MHALGSGPEYETTITKSSGIAIKMADAEGEYDGLQKRHKNENKELQGTQCSDRNKLSFFLSICFRARIELTSS